jgi:putative ABC transport system permease protein
MRWISRWRSAVRERLRPVFFRARTDAEMDEELRFHLEMEAWKLARYEGLSAQEAQRRAGAAFGGIERYKQEVRDARGLAWVNGLRLDFVLGLRMLVKYPALTLVGGLGMAVSIAVSVGFFAFVAAHIYPVLPLDEGDRIVALENRDVDLNDEERKSLHDFVLWRAELKSVESLGAFRTVGRNLMLTNGTPALVSVAEMSAAGFRVARVPPLLGRYLVEDDERAGAPPVLVIGYDVWQRRFSGDSTIVGRHVRFGTTDHTIVGVMPEGFAFPQNHQFWTALRADPVAYARREGPAIFIFGRLRPGVTMQAAQAELAAIGLRTAAAFPESNAKLRPMVMPYTHSLTDIQGTTTWMVVQMQLMMSLLLIVVALNVAVLVYARTATRQGEIAVRTALGASRRRIVAQLFVEALVLSLGAAALGLELALVGFRLGNRIMEQEMGVPFWLSYSIRPATVLFTVGVAVVAAMIVGVLPALQVTGSRLQTNLRQLGGGAGTRLGKTWTALIVAQVAIAVAALPAAVSTGWNEIRSATTRPTYPAQEFLMASLGAESPSVAADGTNPGVAPIGGRLTELLRRLEAEPDVVGASYDANLVGRTGPVEVEGVSAPAKSPAGHRVVSEGVAPDYTELFGARILAGRPFEPADLDSLATAIIVNRAFARQILHGESALGRRVRYARTERNASPPPRTVPERWYEIVGVVEDLQTAEVDPDLIYPRLYYPVSPALAHLSQELNLDVHVRAPTTPADFAPRLRQLTAGVDPTLRLGTTHSLDEFEREGQLAMRLVGLAVGLVLLSVFLLSAAGVYALTSFTVTRRRREIGIRTALGAHPGQVLRSIFARVARQISLGLVVGIAAAVVVDRLTGGELTGGHARVVLPALGVMMAVVALLAAIGPARRGLRIQPTEALRADA